MRYLVACALVLVVAAAAAGGELSDTYKPIVGSGSALNTLGETTVRAKPDKGARSLGVVPANTAVKALGRKDFWFEVECEIDGRATKGWVYFTDVTQTLGMSKGQLLERNKGLVIELGKLRDELKEKEAELGKLRVQAAELSRAQEELRKQLEDARKTIVDLKAKAAKKDAAEGKGRGD